MDDSIIDIQVHFGTPLNCHGGRFGLESLEKTPAYYALLLTIGSCLIK